MLRLYWLSGISMAKPIEYIVELDKNEARVFLEDILNPKANPARDATLERARKLQITLK